jgi:antitoxin ParD1/3/4
MAKITSINLGHHFEGFISKQVQIGRYGSASEVIRAGLCLLEEREQKIGTLRQSLSDGENSGHRGEFDMKKIKADARQRTRSGW